MEKKVWELVRDFRNSYEDIMESSKTHSMGSKEFVSPYHLEDDFAHHSVSVLSAFNYLLQAYAHELDEREYLAFLVGALYHDVGKSLVRSEIKKKDKTILSYKGHHIASFNLLRNFFRTKEVLKDFDGEQYLLATLLTFFHNKSDISHDEAKFASRVLPAIHNRFIPILNMFQQADRIGSLTFRHGKINFFIEEDADAGKLIFLDALPVFDEQMIASWIGDVFEDTGKKHIVFVGAPGSGKTTYAKKLAERFNMGMLSFDWAREEAFRHEVGREPVSYREVFEFSTKNQEAVNKVYQEEAKRLKQKHDGLIIHNTHVTTKWQNIGTNPITKQINNGEALIVFLDLPLEEHIKRNKQRKDKTLDEKVIRTHYYKTHVPFRLVVKGNDLLWIKQG